MSAQTELFDQPPENGWKIFRGKNGADVRYLNVDDRIVRVDIGSGELQVTRQTQDRNYTFVPGYGQVQERAGLGGKVFLGKLAMVREIMEARSLADEALSREREAVDRLAAQSLAQARGGGGCKTYIGASTFTEYGPILNPHEEEFAYAKGFLWLLKAPIRAEWVKVYLFCANDARKKTPPGIPDPMEGLCAKSVREISAGAGVSINGAQAAIKGLAEYKLISKVPGKKVTDPRRIYFHEHPWMEWIKPRVARHDTPAYHDAPPSVARRDTVYKEALKKEKESARDATRDPDNDRDASRDVNSIFEGLENEDW